MCPTIVAGIESGEALVNYWPLVSLRNRTAGRENGKTLLCDKRHIAITCEFYLDIISTLIFSCLYKKIRLKESEVWRKVISFKIIVTLDTQGLQSSFLSCPVA